MASGLPQRSWGQPIAGVQSGGGEAMMRPHRGQAGRGSKGWTWSAYPHVPQVLKKTTPNRSRIIVVDMRCCPAHKKRRQHGQGMGIGIPLYLPTVRSLNPPNHVGFLSSVDVAKSLRTVTPITDRESPQTVAEGWALEIGKRLRDERSLLGSCAGTLSRFPGTPPSATPGGWASPIVQGVPREKRVPVTHNGAGVQT